MGVKDVDLCEKRHSEQLPDDIRSLLLESVSTKNESGVITDKELQELMNSIQYSEPHKDFFDLEEAGIVHNLVHYEERLGSLKTGINPAFTCDPIPVSGPNKIAVASVECDDQSKSGKLDDDYESNFETVCDAKDFRVPELARPVLESKRQEENQPKGITEPTLSQNLIYLIQKRFWTVMGIVILCYAFSRAPGADATHRGIDFPPFIELHHPQVPQLDHSRWLLPRRTIQQYKAKEGNKLHQNLRINNSEVFNYDLEIVQTGGNVILKRYFLKALKSCALAENEDLLAFMEGKKSSEVELSDGTILFKYLLLMQNQTLHVHFLEGTDRLLDLHVQCNFTFETIDPVNSAHAVKNSENETTTVENGGKEKSSDVVKILVYASCAGGLAIVIALATCYALYRLWRSRVLGIEMKKQGLLGDQLEAGMENQLQGVASLDV